MRTLSEDLLNSKSIVVIGAGQLGKLLLQLWPKNVLRPSLFLDEKVSNSVEGIEVQNTKNHKFTSSNLYILAFFKFSPKFINELFREVINQEIITAYDLLNLFQPDLFSNGWVGDISKRELTLENLKYFDNERSRKLFRSIVQWRYGRELREDIHLISESQKYDLTKFGVQSSEYEFICDGGSYDLSFLYKQAYRGTIAKTVVALEPDTHQLKVIEQILQTPQYSFLHDIDFHLDRRALWSSTGKANFFNNGTLAARIARAPDCTCVDVKTVTLLDLFGELKVSTKQKSLVKLHIEGAEWPVIESSFEYLLSFDHLDLLINLSHDEESLLFIPRILGSSGKYRLFLELHALFGEGATLFARTI